MVNVLVSTYNGEKYIKEQIDSILNQTYKDICIWVRDDGSIDNTVQILKEYEKDKKLHLTVGQNVGYGASFLQLLKIAGQGEYWAFCDQDDIWLESKIERAVKWLSDFSDEKPRMFHSAYYNTNEKLEIEQKVEKPVYKYCFTRSITECIHMGFSSVLNRPLRELVLKGDPKRLITHDWWTELVVMKFGEVYYDNDPMSLHRRLDSSVSANTLSAKIAWLKRAWKGNAEINSITKEFDRVFGKKINDQECKIVRWFCFDKYSFIKSIKKAFYWKRWRPTWSSELVLRFMMLFGKI